MGADNGDDAASRKVPGATARAPTGKEVPPLGAVLGGRFQLEGVLGRGGTGVVFRAFDRVMGEPIAVKLLFPERAADDGWVRRLVREVKVARTIVHPNVRRIFEIGQVDGYWLITMELGTGTLGDRLRGRRDDDERPLPPWPERREDARAVCDGLAAIHASGITHRDVTPQNVLRMSDGRLVISDFGLALLDGETTALIAGTPNYVAHEVLSGERPDQGSDVWQLGLVLHEIVFERRPRWHDVDGRRRLLAPLGIEDATPIDHLMPILRSCLSVDRDRRARTAVAIAEAFEGATTDEIRVRHRVRRWGTRGLVVGAFVVAGALVAMRLSPARRSRTLEPAARRRRADAVAAPVAAAARRARGAARQRRAFTSASRAAPATRASSTSRRPRLWGVTPLDVERAPPAGTFTLRIAKPRFVSVVLTIDADREVTATVELRPHHGGQKAPEGAEDESPAPAAAPPPATVDEPGKL